MSRIDLDEAALGFHAVVGIEEREVGGLADGEDHAVGWDVLDVRFVEQGLKRPSASKTERHFTVRSARDVAVSRRILGAAAVVQVDAFLVAFLDFDVVGGHFVALFEADDVDFFIAAHAQGGAGHVVGHCSPRSISAMAFAVATASMGRSAERATS